MTLNALAKNLSEDHLIVFNKKSLAFIAGILLLFVFLVFTKTHYSSMAMWDQIIKENNSANLSPHVLCGTPKHIRIDEWHILTPLTLSQAAKNYPVHNYSCGPEKVPLLLGLPCHHFSTFFRPYNWGYFLFGVERGFAFFWNYGVFVLILTTFLLCMLLTNSNFWISLFGSLFLFFSSFIQWWDFWGVLLVPFNCILLSIAYLVLSKRRIFTVLSAFSLVLFTVNFALVLYPAFQVPIGLLLIACCLGYLANKVSWPIIKINIGLRISLLLFSVFCICLVGYFFYNEVKDTVSITMNTSYPGKRSSLGGTFGLDKLFTGFYCIFFNEHKFLWQNICETSSFIFLFPPLVVLTFFAISKKKIDYLQIALSGYLLFLTVYVAFGFPQFFAKLFLLTFSPSYRAVIGLGVANILLITVFLGSVKQGIKIKKFYNFIIFSATFIVLLKYGFYLNIKTDGFISVWQVLIISLFFSLATVLLLNQKKKIFCFMLVAFVVLSTYSTHPISKGLNTFFDKKLYQVIKNIATKDPDAKWIVYGNFVPCAMVKAAGANVFNGTKYCPDIAELQKLDTLGKNRNTYNRFAHIDVMNRQATDSINFKLLNLDHYAIAISPFNRKLDNLHIRYILMPSDSSYYNVEIGRTQGVEPIIEKPIDNFWILYRKHL